MPPRSLTTRLTQLRSYFSTCPRCGYATAAAITPAAPIDQIHHSEAAIERYPPSKPPSYRPADTRKSQLLRQYISLLRTIPLTLFFQHNNLKANEWAAIRRELTFALQKTSESSRLSKSSDAPDPASSVRFQVIRTGIFAVALRLIEFYKSPSGSLDGAGQGPIPAIEQHEQEPSHYLSPQAYRATLIPPDFPPNPDRKYIPHPEFHKKRETETHALLYGPIAALTFPDVSPEHLATALSILAPTPGSRSAFPAPKRREAPGWHEPAVQNGIHKLLLLGARVEGRTMDGDGVRWMGGLAGHGGLDGLRGELVTMLQRFGMGITSTLEGASRNLWITMESRRSELEKDEGNDTGQQK